MNLKNAIGVKQFLIKTRPDVSSGLILVEYCLQRLTTLNRQQKSPQMSRGMGFTAVRYCDQQSIRSACAYAQSDQNLC